MQGATQVLCFTSLTLSTCHRTAASRDATNATSLSLSLSLQRDWSWEWVRVLLEENWMLHLRTPEFQTNLLYLYLYFYLWDKGFIWVIGVCTSYLADNVGDPKHPKCCQIFQVCSRFKSVTTERSQCRNNTALLTWSKFSCSRWSSLVLSVSDCCDVSSSLPSSARSLSVLDFNSDSTSSCRHTTSSVHHHRHHHHLCEALVTIKHAL